jgi:dienelactone hydrolase
MERVKRLLSVLDDELIADVDATFAHLERNHGFIFAFAVVGFCMGGRASHLDAAAGSGCKWLYACHCCLER